MPGRPRGAHSYSDAVSLNIVDAMLPCNSLAWDGVAEEYQRRTGEPKKREGKDIKKHFIVKLCRSGKKPTGTSELTKIEAAAQAIYKRILDREHAASYGAMSSDEDDGPLTGEVDEEESEMTSQHSSQHEGLWDTDEPACSSIPQHWILKRIASFINTSRNCSSWHCCDTAEYSETPFTCCVQ